ncbi:MAG: glycosyltransferase, partial [Schleiferiaceae bacterium]|nr:glycosyltransferase [Schleiferiaceae bacterium]
MPRVLLSVINDVHTDNRIHRTATVFQERGYDVSVVGRQWPNPAPVERPYAVHRFVCRRNKGALFYLEYQIRLLRYLLRESFDVYVANDLDTLLPMSLAAFLRKKPLFYDSHEYFCGVPELARRPAVRAVWLAVERFCMPLVT